MARRRNCGWQKVYFTFIISVIFSLLCILRTPIGAKDVAVAKTFYSTETSEKKKEDHKPVQWEDSDAISLPFSFSMNHLSVE